MRLGSHGIVKSGFEATVVWVEVPSTPLEYQLAQDSKLLAKESKSEQYEDIKGTFSLFPGKAGQESNGDQSKSSSK